MGRKRREYSYDDWKKAMDLHRKYKFGPTRISRVLGINENTVNNWLYYGKMPPLARWIAKPCTELTYTKGVVDGDGSVSKNEPGFQYKIILATIDPDFAETFSRAMSRLLGVEYHKPYWSEEEKKWRIEYCSLAFYTWYKKTEEKGLEGFKPYIEYSKETGRYYLKGLFDSDGNNNGNKQIQLSNTNKELLEYVQYLLKEYFDIIATGPYLMEKAGIIKMINGIETTVKHDSYRIQIGRKSHVQAFLEEIGFSIVRKQLGLRKHEKVYVAGIGYVEPYELVELGLFELPFNQ